MEYYSLCLECEFGKNGSKSKKSTSKLVKKVFENCKNDDEAKKRYKRHQTSTFEFARSFREKVWKSFQFTGLFKEDKKGSITQIA